MRPSEIPSAKERFTFEAKAASALNHPSIVTVYDVGEAAGQDFIAMEYVDGKTLEEQIGQGPLPIDRALEIAPQIVDALSAAQRAGIVHRDLNPSNIMVNQSGAVKVLDFGLAKLVAPDEVDDSAPTEAAFPRTEQGIVLGTAAYMSPEYAEGKPVDLNGLESSPRSRSPGSICRFTTGITQTLFEDVGTPRFTAKTPSPDFWIIAASSP